MSSTDRISLRQLSKGVVNARSTNGYGTDEVQAGALQRIADACENIAKDKITLLADIAQKDETIAYYVRRIKSFENEVKTLKARAARYKNLYTKELQKVSLALSAVDFSDIADR